MTSSVREAPDHSSSGEHRIIEGTDAEILQARREELMREHISSGLTIKRNIALAENMPDVALSAADIRELMLWWVERFVEFLTIDIRVLQASQEEGGTDWRDQHYKDLVSMFDIPMQKVRTCTVRGEAVFGQVEGYSLTAIFHRIGNEMGGLYNDVRTEPVGEWAYRYKAINSMAHWKKVLELFLRTKDERLVSPLFDVCNRVRVEEAAIITDILLDIDLDPRLVVCFPAGILEDMFANIFTNAQKAAAHICSIKYVYKNRRHILCVSNDGDPFSEEAIEAINEGQEYTYWESGSYGTGTGLANLRDFLASEGGSLTMEGQCMIIDFTPFVVERTEIDRLNG